MLNEVEKIFYSQFRKAENYIRIVNLLQNRLLSLNDIAKKLGKKSGGSLKDSLRLLEDAEIIKSYISFDRGWKTKFRKYRLSDEYRYIFLNNHQYMLPIVNCMEFAFHGCIYQSLQKNCKHLSILE
ncbi:MAG: hypothetical protein U9N77_11000, partial [Thermodesulfobacteriota bacterium]|nr:hypothetical protein [Thermodesulfobacteriota bacterium]